MGKRNESEFPLFPSYVYKKPYVDPVLLEVFDVAHEEAWRIESEAGELKWMQTSEGREIFCHHKPVLLGVFPKDNAGRWRLMQQLGLVKPGRPLPEWAAQEDAEAAILKSESR
jgi:hypothetical protein